MAPHAGFIAENKPFVSAVVVAGGLGLRFGEEGLKQLKSLAGRPILYWSLAAFARHPRVQETVLVAPKGRGAEFLAALNLDFKVALAEGGATRTESVASGFNAASADAGIVLVHDGVRPLVTAEEIAAVIDLASQGGAAILATPCRDTLKKASEEGIVLKTVDRAGLWLAQTPQGFKRDILAAALDFCLANPQIATDESYLAERLGHKVKIAKGSAKNFKITFPEDLAMAESVMAARLAPQFRVGQGFDFHRFDKTRPLWLGCLLFEGEYGLLGHSDADVLAHALIDALLGAAGLGDIGQMFPPGDDAWKGAAGATLSRLAMERVREAGFTLVNADLTLIGETPKIAPRREEMRKALAAALGVDPLNVFVKGTTTEGMGFVGRGEGLAASAVALLAKRP
jgi:2-C-methyl-D-erythritol 4-phosphate cytidylyltransferase/2-C-methyl-D-erythritol 2,4-cyclodiphosphate synthase